MAEAREAGRDGLGAGAVSSGPAAVSESHLFPECDSEGPPKRGPLLERGVVEYRCVVTRWGSGLEGQLADWLLIPVCLSRPQLPLTSVRKPEYWPDYHPSSRNPSAPVPTEGVDYPSNPMVRPGRVWSGV